jgi:threonyl-tRNA synthetase
MKRTKCSPVYMALHSLRKNSLMSYLVLMEEAKKRDHRKLGKELELFAFSQRVGQGLPLWLPKVHSLGKDLKLLKNVQKKGGYLRL